MFDFLSALRPAIVLTALFTLLLGVGYPLAILGIGQAAFPHQANGSLIVDDGKVVGSELVGQAFTSPRYFNTRPSAAGKGYDANSSSGSNLGPTSKALAERIGTDIAAQRKAGVTGAIPADLVTASASGLDPDLSRAAALVQVPRIARERGLSEASVRTLVEKQIEQPALGMLGDPHVNVLALNRQLDRMTPLSRP
ncbi:potassium-transporting ATPase subunit KdpC [Glacieibacterium frigidum]|uniref:Potassium-transporting ATPase KdpC subunit n=1 Tax=Glacieibacterium frigidum TaxID=2593303 RepID=A0A552UI87_9SPHN|nr:potassium-transporting ATPase subunit KdpC [Glacieibacterium frigidum]TRW17939.1 potassium-transporting ATPase subunit KdpC [Glacieibacterium frigidum]